MGLTIMEQYLSANINMIKEVLKDLKYKKGWEFEIFRTTFRIRIECEDSLKRPQFTNAGDVTPYIEDYFSFGREIMYIDPKDRYPFWVMHNFPIDPLPMDRKEAERWILDRIIQVETHEAMEFFKIGNNAVFFPDHDPGGDPYRIRRWED